jgi:hypothetical protein
VVDGEFVDQGEVLVDRVDPLRARVVDALGFVGPTVQPHAARVRLLEAGEDLDQRRLAGAVVAQQSQHLALAQVQVDVAQRRDRAEALRDVLDAQDIVVGLGGADRRGLCGAGLSHFADPGARAAR